MDVEEECKLLVEEIKRLGVEQPSGNIGVTFGTLFDDDRCSQLFEALVGTLRAAKKRSIVAFKGEMLLKGAHDNVMIEIIPAVN
jgi:hypothetical protein